MFSRHTYRSAIFHDGELSLSSTRRVLERKDIVCSTYCVSCASEGEFTGNYSTNLTRAVTSKLIFQIYLASFSAAANKKKIHEIRKCLSKKCAHHGLCLLLTDNRSLSDLSYCRPINTSCGRPGFPSPLAPAFLCCSTTAVIDRYDARATHKDGGGLRRAHRVRQPQPQLRRRRPAPGSRRRRRRWTANAERGSDGQGTRQSTRVIRESSTVLCELCALCIAERGRGRIIGSGVGSPGGF